jgi:hypothetical protein
VVGAAQPAVLAAASAPSAAPSDGNRSQAEPVEPPSAGFGPPAADGDGEADSSYDYLFGVTMRPIRVGEVPGGGEPLIEPVAEPAGLEPGFGATAGWHTAAAASQLGVPDDLAMAARAAKAAVQAPSLTGYTMAGLIDSVPWLAKHPEPSELAGHQRAERPPASTIAAPVKPAAGPAEAGFAARSDIADAESTVNRAAVLAGLARAGSGPTVLAGRCAAGHLTPPHSATCRVCQAVISVQQPFEIARPPLGVLRLSTGDTVTLDRGVLVGRKPTAPEGSAERPHLVRVNSPEHDVSRQHAEFVLEGWHVYIRDLGSTNGTTVTLPGQPPQRLREGELQLLEHGAVIVLADEIQCVFEVTS